MFAIELVEQLNFRCPRFCEIWHVSKGSIDCNAGQPYLGWDTDEFPSDPRTQGRYPIQGWYGVDQRLEEADGNAKPTYVESTKHGLVTSTCTMQPVSTSYQPLINLLSTSYNLFCEYIANCKPYMPYSFSGSRLSGSRSVGLGFGADIVTMLSCLCSLWRKCLLSMLIVVEQGGIAPGGNNFDCKLRRESTDIEDGVARIVLWRSAFSKVSQLSPFGHWQKLRGIWNVQASKPSLQSESVVAAHLELVFLKQTRLVRGARTCSSLTLAVWTAWPGALLVLANWSRKALWRKPWKRGAHLKESQTM